MKKPLDQKEAIKKPINDRDRQVSSISQGQLHEDIHDIRSEVLDVLKGNEPLSVKIGACQAREDFLKLFRLLGIPGYQWQKTEWLVQNGHRKVYEEIGKDPRFKNGGWASFIEFMGGKAEENKRLTERVADCKKLQDFVQLFEKVGIQGNKWQNSKWLVRNGYRRLYEVIIGDNRFRGWPVFLKFMGGKLAEFKSMPERVADCLTVDSFLQLFRELGINDRSWENTNWLSMNGYANLHQSIIADKRFSEGGWKVFLEFMGVAHPGPMTERVRNCIERADFFSLFDELGIAEEKWKSSDWLQKNKYGKLYEAITGDVRFKTGWKTFLKFMGISIKLSINDRVQSCTTVEDFFVLFQTLEIGDNQWRSSEWLQKNNQQGLYKAIHTDSRFSSWPWQYFVACMDRKLPIEGIRSQRQAQEILRQEILRLRGTGKWIVQSSNAPVSREEWAEIRKHHEDNIVVRIVADYLKAQSSEQ